jgi:hypothetical protein
MHGRVDQGLKQFIDLRPAGRRRLVVTWRLSVPRTAHDCGLSIHFRFARVITASSAALVARQRDSDVRNIDREAIRGPSVHRAVSFVISDFDKSALLWKIAGLFGINIAIMGDCRWTR